MRLRSPGRRCLIGLTLVSLAFDAGCHSWRRKPIAPPEQVLAKSPDVRVTLADGRKLELSKARLSGDSIVGLVRFFNGRMAPAGAPVDQIVRLEVREFSTGKTLLLAAGVTAVVVVAAALVASSGDYGTASPADTSMTWSCPLVYSWDGEHWRLESGTFGGAMAPALTRTDVDVLESAASVDGQIRLRLTNELREIDHVDAIRVVPLDHRPGTMVVPDAQGGIHVVATPAPPIGARDDDGREMLGVVSRVDGWAWESTLRERDASRRESLRDGLEITFKRPAGASKVWLVVDAQNTIWASSLLQSYLSAQGDAVDAWYASLDAPERAAAAQQRFIRESFLHVTVATDRGWVDQGYFWEAGPEVMKRQAVPIDLRVSGDVVRVRLTAPPSFWRVDAASLAVEETVAGTGAPLMLVSASAPDGDHREVLERVDGREWTMETGKAAELVFADIPRVAGWQRSYVLQSTGWYRIDSRPGPPDTTLLQRIASDPDGMARVSVERRNAAIRALR